MKWIQTFEGFLMEQDGMHLMNESAGKTSDKAAQRVVAKIIKLNPRFKWLLTELPHDYTRDDVKTALDGAGYNNVFSVYSLDSIKTI